MLKTFILKNGIKVASYNLPNLRSIRLQISVKGGSLVETPKKNGVAHLLEHMLVQGIPSYPTAEEFSNFIESLAGVFGAFTEKRLIGFEMSLPALYLEEAVKIGSEVFFQPLFLPQALEKEKQVLIEETRQRMDDPGFRIMKFFRQTRFVKNHPLTLDITGPINIIKHLKREDLIKYWQDNFLPTNTYIVAVGNFSRSNLEDLLNKYFSSFTSDKKFSGFPSMSIDDFSKRQVVIHSDSKLKSAYINLTLPTTITMSTNIILRTKLHLLLAVLGRMRNSRLFRLLRYQKGLVYDVHAGSGLLPGIGYVYITSEVATSKLEEVISLIATELSAFIKEGVREDELSFVKNFFINRNMMAFDHPSSIVNSIEDDLLWEEKVMMPEEYAEIIKSIKTEDLLAVMKEYWDLSKLNLLIQGPVENSKSNISKLEGLVREIK